jgi:hypothetical protein
MDMPGGNTADEQSSLRDLKTDTFPETLLYKFWQLGFIKWIGKKNVSQIHKINTHHHQMDLTMPL